MSDSPETWGFRDNLLNPKHRNDMERPFFRQGTHKGGKNLGGGSKGGTLVGGEMWLSWASKKMFANNHINLNHEPDLTSYFI